MRYLLIDYHSLRWGERNNDRILKGFLPWIVFAITSSFFGLKIGALIGLAFQIALFVPMARKRTYTIIEAYSLVFFVILVIGFLVLDEQSIENLDGQQH